MKRSYTVDATSWPVMMTSVSGKKKGQSRAVP